MAKDPAQRYQRGMEMVLDIEEVQEGREPLSKAKQPGSPTRSGRNCFRQILCSGICLLRWRRVSRYPFVAFSGDALSRGMPRTA
jgi:hypothetical protein